MAQGQPITFTEGVYNKLGSRTFWYILGNKLNVAIGFLVFAILISLGCNASFVTPQMRPLIALGGTVAFVIFFVCLFYAVISSAFSYRSQKFCLSADAFKIRKGIFGTFEIAIPYRQIQTVDIERTVGDQIMGLSRLIIVTAAQDNPNTEYNEAHGILPSLDKEVAIALQEELLKRADVQKFVQLK